MSIEEVCAGVNSDQVCAGVNPNIQVPGFTRIQSDSQDITEACKDSVDDACTGIRWNTGEIFLACRHGHRHWYSLRSLKGLKCKTCNKGSKKLNRLRMFLESELSLPLSWKTRTREYTSFECEIGTIYFMRKNTSVAPGCMVYEGKSIAMNKRDLQRQARLGDPIAMKIVPPHDSNTGNLRVNSMPEVIPETKSRLKNKAEYAIENHCFGFKLKMEYVEDASRPGSTALGRC